MRHSAIRLFTLATIAVTLSAAPVLKAYANGR